MSESANVFFSIIDRKDVVAEDVFDGHVGFNTQVSVYMRILAMCY